MKIHIGVKIPPLGGYTNIDPIGGENKISGDFRNLDAYCEDNECIEILGPNVLDYIHGSHILHVLNNYVKKLRHGGTISLGGTELVEVSRKVITGEMHIHEANIQLFGKGNYAWEIKQGCYSLKDIVGILEEKGLNILSKRTNGTEFIVKAYRE